MNQTQNWNCAGIFKQPIGARNRVGTGLSYRPVRATRPTVIGSLESILGLLKSLKSDFTDLMDKGPGVLL